MFEAIIFDFDGLIIDTETPEFESWQDIFQSYGVTLDRELWDSAIGRHSKDLDIYGHLADLSGERIEREVVRPKMRRNYLERIERNPVLPGVEEYLGAAERMGLKLAVASSSSPGWAVGHLKDRGLLDHFEFVLDAGCVVNAKPDPELYNKAMERLGVKSDSAFAIEDSTVGLTAAKAAGLRCVVVPNPMTMRMDFSSADVRLGSLADLPLANLLAMLEGRSTEVDVSLPKTRA